MEITYTRQGDYLLPNLTLPEQDNRPIGRRSSSKLRIRISWKVFLMTIWSGSHWIVSP